jgi:hypothetical protein
MSGKSPKKETGDSKRAREQRERQELILRRNQQLLDAQKALGMLKEQVRSTASTIKQCNALSSHAKGFYEEINKLTKGKVLIGVTDLAVVQANDIVLDAKRIVKNDVHLDRIKEFVPAGDNPVYPDVLVVIRSIRDSLDRYHVELENSIKTLRGQAEKAATVIGALEYVLDDETDEEEGDKNYPSKAAIEPYVEGIVSDSCLSTFADSYEKYFDFDQLDRQTVETYLSVSPESDPGEVETKGQDVDGVDRTESPGLDDREDEEADEDEQEEEQNGNK